VLVAHSGKTFELDCQSNTRCVLFSTGDVGIASPCDTAPPGAGGWAGFTGRVDSRRNKAGV
jgi:hypothetical protein